MTATLSFFEDLGRLSESEFAERMGLKQLSRDRWALHDDIDRGTRRWNVEKNTWERVPDAQTDARAAQNLAAATGGASVSGGFNWQTGTFGDATQQAKDLAEFNLGLNERQSQSDLIKRSKEFEENTARQMRVNEQQNKWQSDLNRETQEAQTNRLKLQIEGQNRQQDVGNLQQNLMTSSAVRLASRGLGGRQSRTMR